MTVRAGPHTERSPDGGASSRTAVSGLTALLMLVGLARLTIAQPILDLLQKNESELSPGAPIRADLLGFGVALAYGVHRFNSVRTWLSYLVGASAWPVPAGTPPTSDRWLAVAVYAGSGSPLQPSYAPVALAAEAGTLKARSR